MKPEFAPVYVWNLDEYGTQLSGTLPMPCNIPLPFLRARRRAVA